MDIRPDRRAWVFIAVAVALASASAALARLWLPGALASGAGAGLSVLAGVWSARGAAALQARDSQQLALGDDVWHVRADRLPLVRDLRDPVALGVHPAATLGTSLSDRLPPFVTRQFSSELGQVLKQDRFVLLVGESTAGKSRAAYEMMRAELPGYRVVQPTRRDGVLAAAACAAATPRTVLWLDDLERFLGSGGLTGAAVRDVLDADGAARFIVATMRSEEYAKFSGRSAPGLEGIGRDALRQGWDVLRLAVRIEVPRRWSAEEIGRARQLGQDPRLAEAVRHADEYGVAEYLAAAPQLLAEWRDAWAPATHPRAAAMILAAVDARRAGVHRPLSLANLRELHEPYLRRRGGERLRPEGEDAAMAWATTPLYATSSLLIPADSGFLAFDYLIDALDKERMPADALDALIAMATPGEALDVGRLAWGWSLIDQADSAFRRAEDGGLFEATEGRCALIAEERAGGSAALRFAQDAAGWTTAVYGPDHPQTLEAQSLVASLIGRNGDRAAALRMMTNLVAHSGRVLGVDHKITLDIRAIAVALIGELGHLDTAVKQCEEVASDCARYLGEDHQTTISCRDQAAMWSAEAGHPDRAVRMYEALLADMTDRFRSRGDEVLITRAQFACCLNQTGNYDRALREWEQLVPAATSVYGMLHGTTLYIRDQHAWCVGESGDLAKAVQLLEHLLSDVIELDDPQLVQLLLARRSLAWWIGESGDPARAVQQYQALVDDAAAQRGPDDPRVRSLRLILTHWNAVNGQPKDAPSILQCNIRRLTEELRPGSRGDTAAKRHLARWPPA